jgi:hypothetical protein
VEAVNAREAQLETLRGELTALDQLTQVGRLDRIQLERTARECLTDWQGLLAGQPVQARQMLRKLLEGRLVFTPMADGTAVEFRGTGVLDPVLRGIVDGDGVPKASGSRWSHHRLALVPMNPECCAREARSGRERVTALTGQAIRHLEAFGGVLRVREPRRP